MHCWEAASSREGAGFSFQLVVDVSRPSLCGLILILAASIALLAASCQLLSLRELDLF